MEEKTLYVSDLDGTLMHKDLKISDFSVKTINALVGKGVAFTYATARSISSAGTITKDLKLKLPVITRNGAVLADNNTGKIIEKALFTEKEVEMLKDMLPELPKTGFVSCYFGDDMKKVFAGSLHTAELQGYLDYYKDDPSVVSVSDLSEMFMGNPGYVTIIGDKDEIEPLYIRTREYKGWECLFQKDIYRDEYWLEIAPRNSTKAKSILKLKEEYGFDKLVVFGDSVNDIPMFKIADEAYAVSNAVDELKALATGIIGNNEEDAVAVYLSKAEPGML
ncbi:MAG: HAD hydrolase family protein [Clostridiales bacterium]|nr:HAD hydrolase family protein [Clostridiales bacterium]